jgi:hypothetical protein
MARKQHAYALGTHEPWKIDQDARKTIKHEHDTTCPRPDVRERPTGPAGRRCS